MTQAPVHRFSHQAMGTFFEILIAGEERAYAGQASQAAFREIERIEGLFSRFNPASEISRINRLGPGEVLPIGLETYECLTLADRVRLETSCAFDINVRVIRGTASPQGNGGGYPELEATDKRREVKERAIGSPLASGLYPRASAEEVKGRAFGSPLARGLKSTGEYWGTGPPGKPGAPAAVEPSPFPLEIHRTDAGFEARQRNAQEGRVSPVLDLDLGAIGKGYALDRAIEILGDWSIENALIHGGTSTAIAIGTAPKHEERDAPAPYLLGPKQDNLLDTGQLSDAEAIASPPISFGWPVGVGGGWPCPDAPREILLTGGRALSGSGTEVKGPHIIDPRTGRPARGHLAAWALHPSAAAADALSTAFMIMDGRAVEAYCRRHPEVWGLVVKSYGECLMFGEPPCMPA